MLYLLHVIEMACAQRIYNGIGEGDMPFGPYQAILLSIVF